MVASEISGAQSHLWKKENPLAPSSSKHLPSQVAAGMPPPFQAEFNFLLFPSFALASGGPFQDTK